VNSLAQSWLSEFLDSAAARLIYYIPVSTRAEATPDRVRRSSRTAVERKGNGSFRTGFSAAAAAEGFGFESLGGGR